MTTITKANLASQISISLGISISGCEDIINQILDAIITLTKNGDTLHIKNFGSFAIFLKKSRPGRDMLKHNAIIIGPKTVMRFSAAQKVRKQINSYI